MVSTRRGTSGGQNPPVLPSTHPEGTPLGQLPPTASANVNPIDPNLPGSSGATPQTVTLTMAQLQQFMMDCQKRAFADARAEFQAQGALPPPVNEPQPPVAQNRPIPPTPGIDQPPIQRREGPTDSTAHTPDAAPIGVPPKNAEIPPRPRATAPVIPPPPLEEVAESTCQEVRGPRTRVNRDLPRDCPRERPPIRPGLEEVSQQILQLSRKVEDLARGKAEPHRPAAYHDRPPQLARRDESGRARRERGSPFCEEIVMERIAMDSCVPTSLPRYDGSTDPLQHILKFEHLMELHGHSANIYAKILVTTFQDLALEWFTRLEPGSIESYDQLTEKFLHQFASKRRSRLPYTNLYSVK